MRITLKQTLIIILIYSTLSSFGQNNLIGIKGGVALTNIYADAFHLSALNPETKTGFCGGLTFEHAFKRRYKVGADLIYEQRGFITYFTSGISLYTPVKTYFNYNYLTIPIKFGLNFGDKINGFVNIGICPSYLTNSSIKDTSYNLEETDKVARFDLGVLIETGIGYKFKQRYIIYTSLAYQRSFTTFNTPEYFYSGAFRHIGLAFSAGLKYRLTKI